MKLISRLLLLVPLCILGASAPALAGPEAGSAAQPVANVMEVVARGRHFQAPDSVPAGWVTFHFRNHSGFAHFAVVERMPEGYGIKEQQKEIAPVFQAGMDLLAKGQPEAATKKFGELPAWSQQIVYLGGPGLTSPGMESSATVKLEPGTYLLECYVKTHGQFHSYSRSSNHYGMVHQFTVTPTTATSTPPAADIQIQLSSARGIEVSGAITPGAHTVAVHFADQKTYANFVGHDVHLVRLKPETDEKAVNAWMDWTQTHGLETPSPADFMGGLEEMPAGMTGYFTVNLKPGRYAWVAEIPDPAAKGMFKTFEVRDD